MAKSIKLKNNIYIDSTSIVHGKTTLNDILTKLIPVSLFDDPNGVYELGTYELTDNINNYTYLEVFVGRGSDYGGYSVKFLRKLYGVNILLPYYSGGSYAYIKEFHLLFNEKNFTINKLGAINLSNGEPPDIYSRVEKSNKIYKILGYK